MQHLIVTPKTQECATHLQAKPLLANYKGFKVVGKVLLLQVIALALSGMLVTNATAASTTFLHRGLSTLKAGDTTSLYQRKPGCRVSIRRAFDTRVIGAAAANTWVLFRTPDSLLELPVLSRGTGDIGPEVEFGGSGEGYGGTIQGVLQATSKGSQCPLAPDCLETPAHLTVTYSDGQAEQRDVFNEDVMVTDQCGASSRQRFFVEDGWVSRTVKELFGR